MRGLRENPNPNSNQNFNRNPAKEIIATIEAKLNGTKIQIWGNRNNNYNGLD